MNERQQERIAHRTLVLRPNQGAALTRVTQSTGYSRTSTVRLTALFGYFFTRFASFAGKSVVLTWSGAAAGSNRSGVIVRNTGELTKNGWGGGLGYILPRAVTRTDAMEYGCQECLQSKFCCVCWLAKEVMRIHTI